MSNGKTYKLEFEKYNKEDILEIPYIYPKDKGESGKPYNEIWEEYVKSYEFTRKKVDYLIENLIRVKRQLERDFNDLQQEKNIKSRSRGRYNKSN